MPRPLLPNCLQLLQRCCSPPGRSFRGALGAPAAAAAAAVAVEASNPPADLLTAIKRDPSSLKTNPDQHSGSGAFSDVYLTPY